MSFLPFAHALVARQDLPVPAWLFAWGASIVLIVSFFALCGRLAQAPLRGDALASPRGGALARAGQPAGAGPLRRWSASSCSASPSTPACAAPKRRIATSPSPSSSSPPGSASRSSRALLGDIFRPFNPWRAVGRAAGAGFRAIAGQRPAHLAYPERLGRWPAAIGLLAVVWLEVVYGSSGGVAVGLDPHAAATAALVYSGYTLAMMALFGTEEWCERGEVFSVYFGMFSQLGCFGVEDGRLGRRRPLAAATHWATVPGSAAVVIASIATTSFDGAQEGAFKSAIESSFDWFVDRGVGLTASLRLTDTIFMLLCFAGVGLVYMLGVRGMRTVRGAPSLAKLRAGFAHTLIPIALAYLVAHYFSLFVFQEQAQFTYLLSDPLGTAHTDLFGTASGGIDFTRAQRQRDLVRPGRRPRRRPRPRPHPGPRPRPRLLARLPPGLPLPVLDAGGDGRLHLLRPLPALGLQRVTLPDSMLPLAHVGHYLWVFYLLPVVFVVARHRQDDAPPSEQGDRRRVDGERTENETPAGLTPPAASYRISARRCSSAAEISSRTGPSASRSTRDSRKPSMISDFAAAGSSPREVR